MLNAALGVGIGLLVSWGTKKITEAAQRVQNVATQSKEAADAAQSATSSLKDLVNAYEELGDKSGWDTDDFDQAKDIQAEILDLAKEQGTLDEDKLSKLNLQNGKYEEQLGLLQDITAEQLEASRYELTQNKDAQGDKLVDTAKKNNRTHYLTVWSAPEMDMGDQIKNAGIDVFNKFGGYGPDDLNDADSIIDYYNEVGKALKYVIDHTTEAERAAGGTYHSLYQFLLDEQSALRDDVDSYNDSTDAINNNTNARRKLQAVDFWQNDNNNSMDVSFTFDKVNSAVQALEDTIDGFDASKLNELLWGTNEGLSDEQAQALANLRKALTDMDFSADTNGVNAFIQALVQVGIVAQSSANGVDALAAGAQKMEDISSKINKNQFATAGHNHDSRYYTESEIDSKLDGKSNVGHTHDYLPTAGGTMNGTIAFSDYAHGKIYAGPTDNVNGPGGDLNNLVLESWWGLSFTTGCPNQTYTGKTAVGIDCREGIVKAVQFDGKLNGTAARLGRGGDPNAPMTFNWSGKDGQPTWLWGGEDGTNMYVYNPGNFSVNWAQGAANGVYANGFKSSRGGYIRFCNGLQICWGENNKNTTAAVFDVPFKTVDYTLVLGGTDDLNNAWYIASRTTTGFTPKQNGFAGVTNWIAIGRWN